MLDGHAGTFSVDRTQPPARARHEHEPAPLVEQQLDAGVAGLAQVAAFEDAASLDLVGKRRRLRSGQAPPGE